MADPVCKNPPIREGHPINAQRAIPDGATQVAICRRTVLPQAVLATAPAMRVTDAINSGSLRFTFLKPQEKKA